MPIRTDPWLALANSSISRRNLLKSGAKLTAALALGGLFCMAPLNGSAAYKPTRFILASRQATQPQTPWFYGHAWPVKS